MDITLCKTKKYSNSFINGETVNYTIAYAFTFLFLIFSKQFFKIFLSLETKTSCVIAFILAEAVFFLLQRFFVFKNNIYSSNSRQIIFNIFNIFIHYLIFKFISLISYDVLESYTIWFISSLLIYILNYLFIKIFVFRCRKAPETFINGRIYTKVFNSRFVIISSIASAVAMFFIFIVYKVFPLGDTTVLRMDLYHQYGPLFVELFDRITNHESFIYSWTSGGGSSFLGNYFNYLSSPLNLIILLFDRDQMPFAISILVALKCSLSAGAFTLYLKISQKRHSLVTASFGLLYSFSAYILAYFWNIMWLDGMILLPLILLGIEKIVDNGKCVLYIASLSLLLYSSYYIGYMVCIFSVIYFFAYFLISYNGKYVDKDFLSSKKHSLSKLMNVKIINRCIKFGISSVIVGGLCAFFLVPVYFILSGCSATSDYFPSEIKSYFTILDFIQNHFAGLETTIRSSGDDVLPNVYCGVITLILAPLFVVNNKIRLKEKVVYISLLLILFVSFNTNYLNFIWHAFHFPNDLPYRFSFIYSFILLIIAFKALKNINALGIKEIVFVSLGWIAFIAFSQEIGTNKMSDFTIYSTAGLIIIWCFILYLSKGKRMGKFVINILILATAFCEIIIADTEAFNYNQTLSNYNKNYTSYVNSVNYLKENDNSFYRTELCNLNTRMDPCIYGYRGISAFSSMAYENYSRLQYSLGMYGNRINSYSYNTQTPIYNMMYSIKYLIYNGEEVKPSTDLYTRLYNSNDDSSVIYQNDYYLPISYCISSAVDNWSTTEGNPFQLQSDFFTLATGLTDVFTPVEYTSTIFSGMSGDIVTENGIYSYQNSSSNLDEIEITIRATQKGNIYLYFNSSGIDYIYCTYTNTNITQSIETPYILDLGSFDIDDEIKITINSNAVNYDNGSYEIYAYSIDNDILQKGYEKLLSNSLNITDYSDTKIKGIVTADFDSTLYSSIPYDEGWSIYVDGVKAETESIGNCLLSVDIKAGTHTIEYSYTPKGLIAGFSITIITISALILAYILIKKTDFFAKCTILSK